MGMIFFSCWVFLMISSIIAIPVAAWVDIRRMQPKSVVEQDHDEPLEEFDSSDLGEFDAEQEPETELETRLRRLKIIKDSMTQEEMFAHAKATIELVTILKAKGRTDDAEKALEIVVHQPGIGDFFLTIVLAQRCELLRLQGREEEFAESMEQLKIIHARLHESDPTSAADVQQHLSTEEYALLSGTL